MSDVIYYTGMKLEEVEKLVIEKAYRFYGNNKTATANSLGIAIRTLDAKLEKYAEEKQAKDADVKNANLTRENFANHNKDQMDRNISMSMLEEKLPPEIIRDEIEKSDNAKRRGKRS